MTEPVATAVEECVGAVSDTFSGVFGHIDRWSTEVELLARRNEGELVSIWLDDLVEALVLPELSRDGALVIGAGFVAAPGFLVDAQWHLAWWLGHANTFGLGSADPTIRRLEAVEDPDSESFRDYTTLEWWRVPVHTMAQHITGPYVDYLCTDDYTLTLTKPVIVDDAMIGVVGADLYVIDIERMLLPRVRAIDGPATIVNASGRVVVSTDPHRPTGSLLSLDGIRTLPCGSTSLLLVLDT